MKGIGFSDNQTLDDMWLILFRCPFIDHISIFIHDLQSCSLQLYACGQINLCELCCSRFILLYGL
ncbi:hypothetical protein EVA_04626 [gut metagenome]|uniref:Uncharacterized protein n=1 Tax=gut metagenome TaxID=749906 RepID=J9H1H0_9ZZZZ